MPWGAASVDPTLWTDEAVRGRVIRVDRGECDVVAGRGVVRVLSDSQRAQAQVAPVTGDWVELTEVAGLGTVIDRVLPRRSAVSRRDPAERDLEQVLAANVDVVAAVVGLDRPIEAGWLERLLVVAMKSGADPLVVLTKADVADAAAGTDTDQAIAVARAVADVVPVLVVSTVDRRGLDKVRDRIGPGRTLTLIGHSGVGKSSLVNALAGREVVDVGEVRASVAEGRHTTTARELVKLPDGGGLVLDTPGIRTLGLWAAEDAVELVFGDIVELAEQCRFRDCAHQSEPGCAVMQAVGDGELDPRRLERFRLMSEELAEIERRLIERERSQGRRGRKRR